MVAASPLLNLTSRNPVPLALSRRASVVIDNPPAFTAEDIRIHAWIVDRLEVIHRERNSLKAKAAWILFGSRCV